MCTTKFMTIYIEALYKVHVAEISISFGDSSGLDSTDGTGYRAINYIHSQLSGQRRGIHLPVKRQPCVFNALGSFSAYL